MRKNCLRELKRKLFLKYFVVIAGLALGGFATIYIFNDVLNGVIIDFIRLFVPEGDPYTTFENMYSIVLPSVIVFAGFILIYYLCKDLVKYMRILMEGMDDVMQKERSKIHFPNDMKKIEDMVLEVANEYQNYASSVQEDEAKKKDLIYLLAQDIKMPLSSIRMYLEFLNEEKRITMDIKKEYIIKVLHKSLDLEDMINEFFDITRFNLQYAKWNPDQMFLDRMMEQVVDDYYPYIEEKAMDVDLQTSPHLQLYADNDKIARVMRDLLRNMIELGKSDSRLMIQIKQRDDAYEVVMSTRSYHLSAYQIAHIFHNYYRLEDMHGSDASHVLGLGIAKQIVDMQKGTLRASSISDTLTFYVSLPIQLKPNEEINVEPS